MENHNNQNKKLHIVGHKNPDTDSICSALVYQSYLQQLGINAQAYRLGEINNETRFVLQTVGITEPKMLTSLPEDSELVLVDHNEKVQSIDNIENYSIAQVIDHHRFCFETKSPLFIRSEPIASTCSIIAKMFEEENLEISKENAIMMISSIISDTLYFRSPTSTPEDKEIMLRLNTIAQIENLEEYSLQMFSAKSDLGDISVQEIVTKDYKEFEFIDGAYGIGIMETTNAQFGLQKADEISKTLTQLKTDNNLKGVIFSIVDILNEKNYTLYSDIEMKKKLTGAFNISNEQEHNTVLELGNIISRKKQIVPMLKEFIEKTTL